METSGLPQPSFDLSDDTAFRAYCTQTFGVLLERTKGLDKLPMVITDVAVLKQEVKDIREDMKDEKFWTNVKSLSGVGVALLHGAAHLLGIKKF